MKKLIILAVLIQFFSCNSENNVEIWKIHQIGESAGSWPVFRDTDSNKTIKFYSEGEIEIENGDWCYIRDHEGFNSGTYNAQKNEIYTNCYGASSIVEYLISDDDTLYLTYPGIEFSFESYIRVE